MKKIIKAIPSEFKLSDFYQAVTLKSAGFPLLRMDHINDKQVVFVFDLEEARAKEILEDYWNYALQVTAREFVENVNELKTRIHSGV